MAEAARVDRFDHCADRRLAEDADRRDMNHLGYNDYAADARSREVATAGPVAVAADDRGAGELVAQLVDDIGFYSQIPIGLDKTSCSRPTARSSGGGWTPRVCGRRCWSARPAAARTAADLPPPGVSRLFRPAVHGFQQATGGWQLGHQYRLRPPAIT